MLGKPRLGSVHADPFTRLKNVVSAMISQVFCITDARTATLLISARTRRRLRSFLELYHPSRWGQRGTVKPLESLQEVQLYVVCFAPLPIGNNGWMYIGHILNANTQAGAASHRSLTSAWMHLQ